MCFHTRITSSAEEIEDYYNVSRTDKGLELEDELTYYHSNGYDHDDFWVIPQESSANITPMVWGLLPPKQKGSERDVYYKKAIPWGAGLNAQAEKLFSFWQYEKVALTRRCIIPVTGFYEPHTCKKPKDYKVPFYFSHQSEPFVNLAGIYSITPDKHVSFAILTKEPEEGSMYAQIHNKKNRDGQHRQVVALDQYQMRVWLSKDLDQRAVEDLIKHECSENFIRANAISKDLFATKINSNYPDIISHQEHPQLEIPSKWNN